MALNNLKRVDMPLNKERKKERRKTKKKKKKKARSRRCPAETIMNADYADDILLLASRKSAVQFGAGSR